MKLKKIILVMLLSFIFVGSVFAETAPDSFVVSASDLHELDINSYLDSDSSIHFAYKENTSGKVIYCGDFSRGMLSSGSEVYTKTREYESDAISYVLANGYPNKSITGDNDKDYFITSVAVWYFVDTSYSLFTHMDFTAGTYRGNSNTAVKEAGKLISAAQSYKSATPKITVKATDKNLTKSSDGKYYVSSNLGVNKTGIVGNYTVTLTNAPTGAIVTDTSGKSKNVFTTSENFLVKVPVGSINSLSTNFGVSLSAVGTSNKVYEYTSPEPTHQNLFVLYPDTKNVTASDTLKITLTNEVSISKRDATTGEELPGAHLVLKDSTGKVVKEWNSTSTPHKISNLAPGAYTLTETIAPEGYLKSTKSVTFEVKSDGTVVSKVVMENEPNGIPISKVDATTGKELPGAHLVLKNSSGKVITEWDSTSTPHVVSKLAPGKYTLTETIAPKGYQKSTNSITFEVKSDGTVASRVVMENEPKIENPKTGTAAFIISLIVGFVAIGYSTYYFVGLRKNRIK